MKKGFTLIELLVVIAIIGILSSIVLISIRENMGDKKNFGYRICITSKTGFDDCFYGNQYEILENKCIDIDNGSKIICEEYQGYTVEKLK